ncbi:NAD(P)/FAD-dependent oxidoreductase [Pararobbsia silviterrae]|uniref:NAD(P)/FAD-dependent oxidoreductase n=1 Tax=Pararobbsia silviterrae TaxID=1792498 RepID=A0A494Y151_9BURK|nr:NAD(P)/FAD-dependent oxidoreductase [Pararobbsia silviterrae]RKP56515.1 NAD(P)/FAD-dependent oxidoreductase [Pararobbsia silviterrae]
MQRIVVVGGGAGGLELVTRLGDRLGSRRRVPQAEVVLVDRYPTHVWKPLLHEVAAGSMDPFTHQLEYAAQARWHGFEFQQGELTGLDRARRVVRIGELRDEDGTLLLPVREIPYDTLVLAVGSTTHFFGVPGADQYAIALDTVAQAERFRRRLVALCLRARHWHASQERVPSGDGDAGWEDDTGADSAPTRADVRAEPDARAGASAAAGAARASDASPRSAEVRVAIVGGGATGVELSAELRNTAQVLAAYGLHDIDPRHDLSITLVEAGPRLLPALSERLSEETRKLLTGLGVSVMLDARVEAVVADGLQLAGGLHVPADLVVWAAGIKASPMLAQLDGLATNRLGQVLVRPTLQTETDDAVFALGDCASCAWGTSERRVPPRAQAAHQQASFLFEALLRQMDGKPLGAFEYRDLGSLVSLGRFSAVGSLMGGLIGGSMFVEGLFARFMYMSLYRLHIAALHGYPRMMLDAIAHWLRRSTMPRVKLH